LLIRGQQAASTKAPQFIMPPAGQALFADFLWRLNKKSGAVRGRNPAVLILFCAPKLIQKINVLCDPCAIFAVESRSHKKKG